MMGWDFHNATPPVKSRLHSQMSPTDLCLNQHEAGIGWARAATVLHLFAPERDRGKARSGKNRILKANGGFSKATDVPDGSLN